MPQRKSSSAIKEGMFIVNERMLTLWEYAVKNELVADDDTFCKKIGFVRGNLFNVRTGTQGFTTKQILAAAQLTGVNVNWLFGFEPNMFREKKKLTAMQLLKQAVTAMEKELDSRHTGYRTRTAKEN